MTADEFKRIYLPCHQRLYRLAYRLTGNSSDAEDLVQETFLKLWKMRERIPRPDKPEAFALTVLRNLYIDIVRSRHQQQENSIGADEILIVASESVSREVEGRDEVALVESLINRLPANQREVIRMRDVADLSFEEIETATGFSAGNIRTLLSRARKRVKQQFIALMKYEK